MKITILIILLVAICCSHNMTPKHSAEAKSNLIYKKLQHNVWYQFDEHGNVIDTLKSQ